MSAAIAETRDKLNCNAAVIMTDDGVIVEENPDTKKNLESNLQQAEA